MYQGHGCHRYVISLFRNGSAPHRSANSCDTKLNCASSKVFQAEEFDYSTIGNIAETKPPRISTTLIGLVAKRFV